MFISPDKKYQGYRGFLTAAENSHGMQPNFVT
jgi:hypothetical protein